MSIKKIISDAIDFLHWRFVEAPEKYRKEFWSKKWEELLSSNFKLCFRCGEMKTPHTHVASERGYLFLCRECSDDLCAALYFEAEGFEEMAKEKREANCAKQQLLLKWKAK